MIPKNILSEETIRSKEYVQSIKAVFETLRLIKNGEILFEDDVKRSAYYGRSAFGTVLTAAHRNRKHSTNIQSSNVPGGNNYFFKVSFSGFIFSLVDSVPSEIAVASLRNIYCESKWNSHRDDDASAVASIEWMQIDNHCPNASFPVAFCPDESLGGEEYSERISNETIPFLSVELVFAPRHKSGITVRYQNFRPPGALFDNSFNSEN